MSLNNNLFIKSTNTQQNTKIYNSGNRSLLFKNKLMNIIIFNHCKIVKNPLIRYLF